MSLIPLKPLVDYAAKNRIAHGAFNVNMIAQAEAVVEIHTIFNSAAIIQGADLANAFMGGRADFMNGTLEDKKLGAKRIADAVGKLAETTSIPIVLHLDHGKSFDAVKAAIDSGYTSVMIDGSSLSYNDNAELTREVVKYAHERGVSVEAELGVLAGVEDDVFSEASTYTNPMTVCDFFKKTGCDCLAISYGTKHGAVKGENVRLRKEIAIAAMENMRHEGIEGALVSHGSSMVPKYLVDEINELGGNIKNAGGIPVDELLEVIPCGISKINIDTDIRLAVTRNIRRLFIENESFRKEFADIWELMEAHPEQFDPRYYLVPVMTPLISGEKCEGAAWNALLRSIKLGVMESVGTAIVKFGAVGDAPRIPRISLEEMADIYKKKIMKTTKTTKEQKGAVI